MIIYVWTLYLVIILYAPVFFFFFKKPTFESIYFRNAILLIEIRFYRIQIRHNIKFKQNKNVTELSLYTSKNIYAYNLNIPIVREICST